MKCVKKFFFTSIVTTLSGKFLFSKIQIACKHPTKNVCRICFQTKENFRKRTRKNFFESSSHNLIRFNAKRNAKKMLLPNLHFVYFTNVLVNFVSKHNLSFQKTIRFNTISSTKIYLPNLHFAYYTKVLANVVSKIDFVATQTN